MRERCDVGRLAVHRAHPSSRWAPGWLSSAGRRTHRRTMADVAAAVAWISVTPVKGLRLQDRDEVQLGEQGVPGDRAFFMVDERGMMVSATRLGPLVGVVP